ncbi:MAG: 4-aminobutyrate--2-oxoglutarate transaminase [Caldimonas sp.]
MTSINAELQQRRLDATPRGVGVFADFFASRARNAELWDVQGRRFIDFAGGIGVLNTGHLHPKVTAAVRAQLEDFSHTCYQVVPYESYVALAEKLNELAPIDGVRKTAFFTTGAEAVENAIKVARASTGRPAVIAFSGAFHGRTMMGMALTGKVAPYKLGFGPFPGEVFHVPFPGPGTSVADSMASIEALFKSDIEPDRVAAIILEPVQGEGGFHVAPADLLRRLRALCDRHGILLIVDEIQSGFGRTGRWFAIEHSGVQPDLIAVAKSLAGGYPLSALIGKAAVMDAAAPGGLGGTYAGSPVALAAAHAVIDVMRDEGLLERSYALGTRLVARLDALRARVPELAEIRGVGSMIAAEFCEDGSAMQRPDAVFARRVQREALDAGLILLTCGAGANVIRFLYPLTVEDAVFDEGMGVLERAILSAGR